jgi:kumamolisin
MGNPVADGPSCKLFSPEAGVGETSDSMRLPTITVPRAQVYTSNTNLQANQPQSRIKWQPAGSACLCHFWSTAVDRFQSVGFLIPKTFSMKFRFKQLPLAIFAMCALLFSAAPIRAATSVINSGTIVRSVLTTEESAEPINISVALKMRNMDELEARIQTGEKISQDEMEAKYLPLQSDYDQVKAWLQSQGLQVRTDLVDSNHTNIFVRGAVASIAHGLNLRFGKIATGDVENPEITSALSEPNLPDAVGTKLAGIVGLRRTARLKPVGNTGTSSSVDMINNALMTPSDVNIFYNNTSNLTGSGQTIAIYGWATPTQADLTGYLTGIGSTQTLANYTVIPIDGGSNASDQSTGYHEGNSDVDIVLGLAPGAKTRVYAVANASYSSSAGDVLAQIINDEKTDKTITVFTMSAGTVEGGEWNQGVIAPLAQQFAQLAAAGVTVCASSGDAGSNPDPVPGVQTYGTQYSLAVEYPASDPNVTGVGGTNLNLIYNGVGTPTTWNETTNSGSGGGLSNMFSRPIWQTGLGVPAGTQRCVPDVSMSWGGYYTFEGGQPIGIAGTSASGPAFAAYVALLNQGRAKVGRAPLGLLGPQIYPLIGTSAFNDITADTPPPPFTTGSFFGNGAYGPGVGYDLCTGIGTPSFDNLLAALTAPPAGLSVTVNAQLPSGAVANGSSPITLQASATGSPTSYQWELNGVAIPGATSPTEVVYPTAANEGDYTVVVTNSAGTASTDAGTLNVTTDAWIVNLSSRAFAETGANLLIAGFVTTGPSSKSLLIRGVGPTLGTFSVTGFLTDPKLTLLNQAGASLDSTIAWSTSLSSTFKEVGAFALTPGSKDTALLETVAPGAYTAQVISATSNQGVALAEIYDADNTAPSNRLINISARAFVGTGANILIGGFVIGGNTPQTVIIRADGPSLAGFGLSGALTNPTLTLFNSSGATIAANTGWGTTPTSGPADTTQIVIEPLTAALSKKVGAFALTEGSEDSAIVATLPPGAYTAQITGASNSTGVALIEIYEVR